MVHAAMVVADGIDRPAALHQDERGARCIQEYHLPVRRSGQMPAADHISIEVRALDDITHGYAEMGNGSDPNHLTLPE
jgi:hypothetical protein